MNHLDQLVKKKKKKKNYKIILKCQIKKKIKLN